MSSVAVNPMRRIVARLHRTGWSVASRFGRGVTILLYHRVAELGLDPNRLAVSPSNFREHMALLASKYEPLGLEDAARAITTRGLPRRGVVVTFDDGYADNLEEALPILEAQGIPAAFFISTGYVGGAEEFWWDELERLLLADEAPTSALRLTDSGKTRSWQMTTAAQRLRAYHQLNRSLGSGTSEDRERALQELRRRAAEPPGGRVRPTHRTLTVDELSRLDRSPLVEIGAHTQRHPVLANQGADVQRQEIAGSRRDIESWLDRPVRSFSYPFGAPLVDYTRTTVRITRQLGFELAVANLPVRATSLSSPHELPRYMIMNSSGEELERRLALA